MSTLLLHIRERTRLLNKVRVRSYVLIPSDASFYVFILSPSLLLQEAAVSHHPRGHLRHTSIFGAKEKDDRILNYPLIGKFIYFLFAIP